MFGQCRTWHGAREIKCKKSHARQPDLVSLFSTTTCQPSGRERGKSKRGGWERGSAPYATSVPDMV
eukprot:441000-Rhodomonas_salina.6